LSDSRNLKHERRTVPLVREEFEPGKGRGEKVDVAEEGTKKRVFSYYRTAIGQVSDAVGSMHDEKKNTKRRGERSEKMHR